MTFEVDGRARLDLVIWVRVLFYVVSGTAYLPVVFHSMFKLVHWLAVLFGRARS